MRNRSRFVTLIIVLLVLLAIKFYLYRLEVFNLTRAVVGMQNTFLVHSFSCKIPDLNPFDWSVLPHLKDSEDKKCSNTSRALTSVVYNDTTGEHTLEVDSAVAEEYFKHNKWRCCVLKIRPKNWEGQDDGEVCFEKSLVLDWESQFVAVNCTQFGRGKSDEEKPVEPYTNMHAAAIKKKVITERSRENSKQLNVVILGFDSVSRLNLHRSMPKTVEWLQSNRWTEMEGYNKIGDNTLPNLMAILTGLPPDEFLTPHKNYMDDYPYLWKEFSKAGYVTAYAEDEPYMSTFSNYLKGFLRPPTDHYLLDFIWAMVLFKYDKFTSPGGTEQGCIGLKSRSEHVFDYALDFVNVYKDNLFFGLFWVNEFCHNDLNGPSAVDSKVVDFFEKVKSSGTLNSTAFVFLSDHGVRVGRMRMSRIGWYEDRLPFLFISLPEWFKQEHEEQYSNLRMNVKRLSTPYDLHMTLKDVLAGSAPLDPPLACPHCQHLPPRQAISCYDCLAVPPDPPIPHCRSLFLPLPVNRSCHEAGISPHWCTCHDVENIYPANQPVLTMANLVVKAVNERIEDIGKGEYPFKNGCKRLRLEMVLYAWKKDTADPEYVVGVQTKPGYAVFEATVMERTKHLFVDYPISRVNIYGTDNDCVDNPILKEFCFCGNNTQ